METIPPAPPPESVYLQSLAAYWRLLGVRAVAELCLADHLKDGPLPVAALAQKAQSPEATIFRIMRAMASDGFFVETSPRTFALTPVGQLLRSDLPNSFRSMILSEFGFERVPAWHALPHAIRTGDTAFDHAYGKDIWQHYRENPSQGEHFARWMTQGSRVSNQAIFSAFDFSPYETVVDVGGGQGLFIAELLEKFPVCRGILFDLPEVIALAPEHVRLRRVGGSFFESVPDGGDLYVMKWVIHDWDDAKSISIFHNIAKAMKPGAQLMVIEMLIKDGPEQDFVKWMDINMMTMTGGEERTEREYANLLAKGGFKLVETIPTQGMPTLLLATAV